MLDLAYAKTKSISKMILVEIIYDNLDKIDWTQPLFATENAVFSKV